MLHRTAASGGRITFVASNSPPMPTSHTTRSQPWRAKYSKPSAVTISNSVGCSKIESARGLMYSVMRQISSSEICTPSIWMRSLNRMRKGLVYRPVLYPAFVNMLASIAQVEPLPFVPVTWMNFSFRSGWPILSRSALMRSRPGTLPFQQTEWI